MNFFTFACDKCLLLFTFVNWIMKKSKENFFKENFRLLNSQEQSEEIVWSCSSSSDYEVHDVVSNDIKFGNLTNKKQNRKRKRKKKAPLNNSNLNVTIIDVPKDDKSHKSPILVSKTTSRVSCISPILVPTKKISKETLATSPILKTKVHQTSPILHPKICTPIVTSKVKKKLFKIDTGQKQYINDLKKSPILDNLIASNNTENSLMKEKQAVNSWVTYNDFDGYLLDQSIKREISSDIENSEESCTDSSSSNVQTKQDLVKKVQLFFENNFSSQETTQHAISDIETPKDSSKTSNEVEIFTCKSQSKNDNIQSIKEEITSLNSSDSYTNYKPKKVKYKKGGLAFRLNLLLKKQNSNVNLWQHERFLAGNSNFVIPKGEYLVFRIKKVDFKFNCYLLETVNIESEDFLILINNYYVSNNIVCDNILKLYQPYLITDFATNCKLIINVCKFECITMKM